MVVGRTADEIQEDAVIPARLEAGRLRFERWRRTRTGRSRIPERLWTSAVRLAGAYGLCRTARTLHLDYNALKRRVERAGVNDSSAGPTPGRKTRIRSRSNVRKYARDPAIKVLVYDGQGFWLCHNHLCSHCISFNLIRGL